jgi:hypothetical protein
VPYAALQADNVVDISFPDSGGFVSNVTLQTFAFTRPVERHVQN